MTFLRRLHDRGFTLVELLIVILIVGILAAVALPSFLNQTEKGKDSGAQQALMVSYKNLAAVYKADDDGLPSTTAALIDELSSGEKFEFVDGAGNPLDSVTARSDRVSVTRDGAHTATLCAEGRDDAVFCLRADMRGRLHSAHVSGGDSPLALLGPGEALAASKLSRTVAPTEDAARAALSTVPDSAGNSERGTVANGAVVGWDPRPSAMGGNPDGGNPDGGNPDGNAGPTPPVSAGLVRWFTAGALTEADGASVTSWPDSSGQNQDASATQGVSFRSAALNGQPGVYIGPSGVYNWFGEPDSDLYFPQVTLSGARSLVAVASVVEDAYGMIQPTYLIGAQPGGAMTPATLGTNTYNAFLSYMGNPVASGGEQCTYAIGQVFMISATYSGVYGDPWKVYCNGRLIVEARFGSSDAATILSALGRDGGDGGGPLVLGDALIYNSELAAADLAKVHNDLKSKYGL